VKTTLKLNHILNMIQHQTKVKKKIRLFQKNCRRSGMTPAAEKPSWDQEQQLKKVQLPSTCGESGSVARESPGLQLPAHAPAILSHGQGGQTVNGMADQGASEGRISRPEVVSPCQFSLALCSSRGDEIRMWLITNSERFAVTPPIYGQRSGTRLQPSP
jgi:hypothetical protein